MLNANESKNLWWCFIIMNQFLIVMANAIISVILGIITFQFNKKIETGKNKRSIAEKTLIDALIPLLNVLPKYDNTPIDVIIDSAFEANRVFDENKLYIPEAHINKIKNLILLINKYQTCEEYLKKDFERVITKKYRTIYSLIDIYYNEIKRDLGYPYYTVFQYMKYSTLSRYSYIFGVSSFSIVILIIYMTLVIMDYLFAAIAFLTICCAIFVSVNYIYRKFDEKGGLKVIIHSKASKLRPRFIVAALIIAMIFILANVKLVH
jgi:hypothetical protein